MVKKAYSNRLLLERSLNEPKLLLNIIETLALKSQILNFENKPVVIDYNNRGTKSLQALLIYVNAFVSKLTFLILHHILFTFKCLDIQLNVFHLH